MIFGFWGLVEGWWRPRGGLGGDWWRHIWLGRAWGPNFGGWLGFTGEHLERSLPFVAFAEGAPNLAVGVAFYCPLTVVGWAGPLRGEAGISGVGGSVWLGRFYSLGKLYVICGVWARILGS